MGDIEGVHPVLLKELKLKQMAPEPLIGLQALREEVIKDTFDVPRMAVVPIPGRNKYWVWAGIRSYLRLINLKWPNAFAVLDYGPEMPENKMVDLARADFRFASIISGESAKSDRANAREWEAESHQICRPAKPGSRRNPSGLNAYAELRGLHPRSLRADKPSEAPAKNVELGAATDDEKQGSEN